MRGSFTITLPSRIDREQLFKELQEREHLLAQMLSELRDDRSDEGVSPGDVDVAYAIAFSAPALARSNLWLGALWIWHRLSHQHPLGAVIAVVLGGVFAGVWARYLFSQS